MEKLYYKLIRSNMTHQWFKYRLGLNIDSLPFNIGYCMNGGLYVCEKIADTSHYAPQDVESTSALTNDVMCYATWSKFIGYDRAQLTQRLKMVADSTARYLAVCRIPRDTQAVKFVCGRFINGEWESIKRNWLSCYCYGDNYRFTDGKNYIRRSYINECREDDIAPDDYWTSPCPPKIKAHSLEIVKLIDLWDVRNIGQGRPFNSLYRAILELTVLSSLVGDIKKLNSGESDIPSMSYIASFKHPSPYGEEHPENMMVVKDLVEGKINGL